MENQQHFDAVVIGSGFGGIYALKKLRDDMGMTVRVFDKAGGVGGTWYWNRYPGALSDTESFVYCYSWDKELLQEWPIETRYLNQPQILKYLEHVVDRYDLRRDIQLNTGVVSARFDEENNLWTLKTDKGETVTAQFIVTALGLLSATNIPNIKGSKTFKGEIYHTGNWPEHSILEDKRVGVIGTGSTGVQVITAIAPKVKHLAVFQRSAQYSVPVGNGPVTPEYVTEVRANYDKIWDQVRKSVVAFGFQESGVSGLSVTDDERKAIFEKAWKKGGGFRFMFETFSDIATDEQVNKYAQDVGKSKISEIVRDPETVRKLTPKDLYAKRPLCDSGYYATYNRPNVELVDVKENPITEITPSGIKLQNGDQHELDVLIFATGFDAVDGNYTKMDILGRGGLAIKDHWKSGPASYLGVANAKFPNMFMVLGPNGPFTNLPPSIESQVEWISGLIGNVRRRGLATVEATTQAESDWTKTCGDIANMTLFPKAESWIFGANIPGKSKAVYFYMAGIGAYRQQLETVKSAGYQGFVFN